MSSGSAAVITDLGMVTALGDSAASSFAAARAGLRRARELRVVDSNSDDNLGGAPLAGHVVRSVNDGYVGVPRLLRLAEGALSDLLRSRPITRSEAARTGLLLHVSDHFLMDAAAALEPKPVQEPGEPAPPSPPLPSISWRASCRGLAEAVAARCGLQVAPEVCNVRFGWHTGFLAVLEDAVATISAGSVDRCIVGGVGSCVDPRMLAAVAAVGLLKTASSPVGLMPGEAAAFFLVERTNEAHRRGFKGGVGVRALALGRESATRFSEDPPRGVELARVIGKVVPQGSSGAPIVVADLNGDAQRALEWGHAIVRLVAERRLGEFATLVPALSFGETGAAQMALAVALAANVLRRNDDRRGSGALIWSSCEDGARGSVFLEPAVA